MNETASALDPDTLFRRPDACPLEFSQDGLDLYGPPFGEDDRGNLAYLEENTTPANFYDTESPYKVLDFSLNGWQVLFLMSLTF